jgi:Bacterial regulatory proteins, luxR family
MGRASTPRLYALDFTEVPDDTQIDAERLDRMTMDRNIPPTWAMMLLYSDWPPQRVRARAMEIVAASLPRRVAGPAASRALLDLAQRLKRTPQQLLHTALLPQGVWCAVHERFGECERWEAARAATVWLWNTRLQRLDTSVLANVHQRQRVIRQAFAAESNLDLRLVDQIVVALAAEVTAVIERAPELAGMPVEMPRSHGVLVGPEWERDERGHAHAWTVVPEWGNSYASDLIRRVYRHVRRNLLGWAFRTPRLKAAREATQVWRGEIAVTAQRHRPPRSLQDVHSRLTPEAIAHDRSMLKALFDAASPREHQILGLLVQGHSDAEVAATLGCQRQVVYSTRNRLRKKLHALQR